MGQRRKEVQVGICVLISALFLVFGLMWFKQVRFAGGTNVYQVDFPAVDGLQARDRVQVRGIRMGKVRDFTILGDQVRVMFDLDRKAVLYDDAGIRLQTVGIVGEKVVEIQPGAGVPVEEGHIFKGQLEMSMSSIGGSVGLTFARLDTLTGELTGLVRELRRDQHMQGVLSGADSTLHALNSVLGDNRHDLHGLVRDLHATASALRSAVTAPDSGAGGTLGAARRSLARTDSTLVKVERAAAVLQSLLDGLEAGEGTAGKLLSDDQLYRELTETVAATRELIDDIQRNPRKYFKFSVIDF